MQPKRIILIGHGDWALSRRVSGIADRIAAAGRTRSPLRRAETPKRQMAPRGTYPTMTHGPQWHMTDGPITTPRLVDWPSALGISEQEPHVRAPLADCFTRCLPGPLPTKVAAGRWGAGDLVPFGISEKQVETPGNRRTGSIIHSTPAFPFVRPHLHERIVFVRR